ncbi:GyrI-like domain-containing protein [Myxococcus landrumensis]|uniref:GyrI-like domain-containing protein n=2 Tax=Myxococcus landrumensis TaxID=2813577 RepID=A0ABX7NKU3_9BACT|nr:GyrI-like domain-containing protein [Myxococcus landrumus]
MDVSVVSRAELKLVGLKVVGRRSELSHRVPLAWTELIARLPSIPNIVNREVLYGASPERDFLRGHPDGVYTYSVCVEVASLDSVPEGMSTLVLAPCDYAMARIQGAASAIDAAYLGMARWLAETGRKTNAQAHSLERYDVTRQRVTPPYEGFDYDLLKPLAP